MAEKEPTFEELMKEFDLIGERLERSKIGNRLDFLHDTFDRAERAKRQVWENFERRWARRRARGEL